MTVDAAEPERGLSDVENEGEEVDEVEVDGATVTPTLFVGAFALVLALWPGLAVSGVGVGVVEIVAAVVASVVDVDVGGPSAWDCWSASFELGWPSLSRGVLDSGFDGRLVAVDVAAGVEERAGSVPVPFGPEIPNVVVSLFSINASSDADHFVLSSRVARVCDDL